MNEFINIVFRSLKLDKSLYKENRNFGEIGIYFALIIIMLGGIAGAIAASTVIKTKRIFNIRSFFNESGWLPSNMGLS